MKKFKKNFFKIILIFFYEYFISVIIFFSFFVKSSNKINIFFSGAISGNIGGTKVKILRLKKIFGERKLGFNLVYVLSNAPYLNNFSIWMLKKNKIPIILNQNGLFYPAWFKGNWKKNNNKIKNIYKNADYIFFQSKFCKDAAQYFLGNNLNKNEILYNAVDLIKFKPTKKNTKKLTFDFLITGSIDDHLSYRLINIIKLFPQIIKKNNKFRLFFYGWLSKNTKKLCLEMIKQNNLSKYIKINNTYLQIDAPAIYQKHEVYINLKYLDPCPNAVIEALSCGLPVIYSNSGGTPELVGNNAGIGLSVDINWEKIIVPKDDEIINSMLKIHENYNYYSFEARKVAEEKFNIDKWYNNHEKIFNNLLHL